MNHPDNRTFIADGALGTFLGARGYATPFEALNLTEPEIIRSLHRDYVDAGAQMLLTNTFSANPIRWRAASGRDDFVTVNRAAAALARSAAPAAIRVAGSIGPTGLGREEIVALGRDALVENFARQAAVLKEGGVDAFWIETFTNGTELVAALEGCLKGGKGATLIATVSPRLDGLLADGTALPDWIAVLNASGAEIVGINCADAPDNLRPVVEQLFARAIKPIALKLNAGLPVLTNGKASYVMTPENYVSQLRSWLLEPRLKLIGGCCGTTPDFIRKLAAERKALATSNEKK